MRKRIYAAVVLFMLSGTLITFAQPGRNGAAVPAPAPPPSSSAAAAAAGSQPRAATSAAATLVPADTQALAAAGPMRVTVNKSILITSEDELKRVSVSDPSIADAVAVSPHQIMVNGRAPGDITLILWDRTEHSRSFDLSVDMDTTAATREIKRIFPDQQIQVAAVRNALVLSGHVATEKDAEQVGKVAGAFSKDVVNVVTAGPVGADEIMLEVKFAEVDRTALTQLGVNLFSTGATNTFGTASTGQFAPFSGSSIGSHTLDIQQNGTPTGNNLIQGEIGRGNFHNLATFGTNDLLNLSLFRSDINLGAILKLLQQQNVLQILAEPNLIAVNGKEASFLAGGEFPYPVVQGISGAVSVQFKEFGIRLKFDPVIMPNGNIHIRVAPEVSTLDFSNAVTISGFTMPALSTRRAETEVELRNGQSFAIAGLMDNRVTNIMSKMPGIGNIPILGNLFKSKDLQKNKTELMVLVTAHLVNPSATPGPLPTYPYPFMSAVPEKPAAKKNAAKSGSAGVASGTTQR